MKLAATFSIRYLFGKKSRNAINVISILSVVVVAIVSASLFILLSAINGLHDMVNDQFTSFDPHLKIEPKQGKVFEPDSIDKILANSEGILAFSHILEEDVLLKYGDKQYIGRLKGVDSNFVRTSGIDSLIYGGELNFKQFNQNSCVVGRGVSYYLDINPSFSTALKVYVPDRKGSVSALPTGNYKSRPLIVAGLFSVHQDIDESYVIADINFARTLFSYKNEVSAIDIQVENQRTLNSVKQKLSEALPHFEIKDQYEQHAALYKILKSEKLWIVIICVFVLIIASFNIVASLTMLIFEKKNDIGVLQSLGADRSFIKQVFTIEGWFISIIGGVAGLLLATIICYLQQEYALVKVYGAGELVIMAYPVSMQLSDAVIVLAMVACIGYVAAYLPVRYLTVKLFNLENKIQ